MGSISGPTDSSKHEAAFAYDTLLQVRTGKTKTVPNTGIPSAISKHTRKGPVRVDTLGLDGDEQTFFLHGGPDKAVLQYCSAHYAAWAAELPASAPLFRAGAFGENLVAAGMSERSVCIGDVVAIGDGDGDGDGAQEQVRLQVSQPRAPCYKLNHRFRQQDMSRRAQDTSRTGWYYRVLRGGVVQAGDPMRVVERPHPRWTVHAVQEYLHRNKRDEGAVRELARLPALAPYTRDIFARRLERLARGSNADELARAENEDGRLLGAGAADRPEAWRPFRVRRKRRETRRVASFVLEALEPVGEPQTVRPGSHVRIRLRDDNHHQLVRSYSVVGGDADRLEIGVALEEGGRGGSRFLHEEVEEGATLKLGALTESFPLAEQAQRHLMVAGGIGITAFVLAARELAARCDAADWELHVCARSRAEVPFRRHLDALGERRLVVHSRADGARLDVEALLAAQPPGTHVYCCGPARLMDAVAAAAAKLGVIPETNVHFETFAAADTAADPFSVQLRQSGRTLDVPPDETLLDVLREAGLDVPSGCEAGACATCKIGVVSGRVEHRGVALDEAEKRDHMLCCVSRGVGKIVVDL